MLISSHFSQIRLFCSNSNRLLGNVIVCCVQFLMGFFSGVIDFFWGTHEHQTGRSRYSSRHTHHVQTSVSQHPKICILTLKDPYYNMLGSTGLIAFYYPGFPDACDTLCGCGFLGNFYCCDDLITVTAPRYQHQTHQFSNAEAAFQALKFWPIAYEFEPLNGSQAFQKKKALEGQEDFSYGGHGSNWSAMISVLRVKFKPGSVLASWLLMTGNAFLLEHNNKVGRDKIWSDNSDGSGSNWLGLLLMLLRDELRTPRQKGFNWTYWIQTHVNLETGQPRDREWQGLVCLAARFLNGRLRQQSASSSRFSYQPRYRP